MALLVACLGGWGGRAAAQISPGPLARPHQQLEGTRQCIKCHGGGRGEQMTALCLDCHKEIAWLVQQDRGLHARERRQRCATCHPDHAGREFALISWPEGAPERFDHTRAGWPLEGSHARQECAKCHRPAFRVSRAARLSARRAPAWGWVGLERACTSCHDDVHRGALARNCLACHDVEHWKPAPRFDHAKTDYPLTGEHLQVKCAACHLDPRLRLATDRRGNPVPVYKPLAHRECVPCHADPHRGRLGGACSECHVTTGFNKVSTASFNHDRTRYPLRGRHAEVGCEKCHDFSAGKVVRNPAFARCTDCHRDPHAGTATLAGRIVDCAPCHDVQGFRPSTYTVAQHRLTKYPLEGRHQQVKCNACHVKNPAGVPAAQLGSSGVWMRPVAGQCRDCHADDHGAQLASRADRGACAACHRVDGWKPSTYTVAQHASLRLSLEGRHAEIECRACHGPFRRGLPALPGPEVLGRAGVALKLKEIECASCHVDPHDGRFPRCLDCHGVRRFRPSTVDVAIHKRYDFRLEGAHAAVPCVDCHREMKHPATASSLVLARWSSAPLLFAVPKRGCEGCHETPHGAQFAKRPDRGACESCHGLDAFRPATRFDHNRDATFTLKGAHENVPCSRCHPAIRGAGGKPVVVYRPVSGKCETCHGDNVRRGS
ncbi:MAG TPA: cytochrome c3 family protein [Gemmatimonadales bacterium]|nr:cytochrome c3 family protein [Gemmatimonadales bacterium]